MVMKIAILRRTYVTELDGVNRFVFTLADGLGNIGHRVDVFTWGFYGVSGPEDLRLWVREKYDSEARIYSLRDKPGRYDPPPWLRIAWDWLTKGSKLINSLDYDAVIVNGIIPLRFKGKRIAVNHGVPMDSERTDFLKKFVAKSLYKGCTRVCVSKKLGAEFRRFFGLSCHVIPLPLKICQSNSPKYETRDDSILHIGTRPVKNLETSIEVCKEMMKRKIHVKLVVVGAKKEYAERLVESARSLGIDIETMYDLTAREVKDVYARVKALILPSRYEASSYTTLESMASGTPVVVSEAVPPEIVINNYNGFRVKTYNPADYAELLALLLKDPIVWTRLSENASKFVAHFDHISIARKYSELLESMC